MQLNFNELRELLTTLDQTDITEFTLKSDDFEVVVRRETGMPDRAASFHVAPTVTGLAGLAPGAAPASGADVRAPEATRPAVEASVPPATAPVSAPPPATEKWVEISSPMVGTFYRAPAPDEPPFVNVGDRIRTGQTVCIIEAMKLMNELEAEVSGEVVEILVQNGEPVEYGQPLMRVNPL